ncbi:MAG: VG15 protein [Pseudonocardiales bacterium]
MLSDVDELQEANARRRTRLALRIRRHYTVLDLRDLDASWPGYLEAAGYDVRTASRASAAQALDYFVSVVLAAGQLPTVKRNVVLGLDRRHIEDLLRLTGPIRIKQLIGAGYAPQTAKLLALRRAVMSAGQFVTDSANDQIMLAANANQALLQGWRRVLEPGVCAWCRMIAGAAEVHPVYRVTARWRRPHVGCRCGIEVVPVYKAVRLRGAAELAAEADLRAWIARHEAAATVA